MRRRVSATNVLVVYKRSMHRIYFQDRSLDVSGSRFSASDLAALKAAHDSHEQTMDVVRRALRAHGLRFKEIYRARLGQYQSYDFVIAVGGDGTLIEAAANVTGQPLLGVNSDPERSHGFFCAATADSFADYLAALVAGPVPAHRLQRMALMLDGRRLPFSVLNDILIAHQIPAAMSRYQLCIGAEAEVQRGSGIWICTAAGSSGGIHSAGGKLMPWGSRRLQYRPRELFREPGIPYRLTGGIFAATTPVMVRSRMREGCIYVDGAHHRIPFPFGATLEIVPSAHPLDLLR